MITRSTLVEQLRDYQIRSQRKWAVLTLFSSKPHITSRADVVAALSWAFLFCLLVIFSYVTLHFRYFRLSACIVFLGIILPVYLKVSRQRKLAKKRERRLLLPLSINHHFASGQTGDHSLAGSIVRMLDRPWHIM